ncbi:N-Acetyl-D-glucosamine ABC transport system, permease protein 1 [[Actinomadura] parvosata subsp. kistnae]|uniref:ABC transporter permease n=1 Tax=[Actinomadura] parvosata subsp. kistnae TaxID=1909395 RepID=A0A1U9ZY22_9ACTN|nr:sugar ABC transporter permease [Nonomuraea sp. ATCC 55076]AQZ62853.1 ABC transporter permease [Nonomuraea sp. ATCC 55076]SPL98399.1 N-Acetyl-D-glucosamine ABC transport system, permease protein 1 [Actinomadura parvosata subsp. kistnae]
MPARKTGLPGRLSGQRRMERRWGLLMALPAVLGFVIFTAGPMVASFVFSLTDWQVGGTPAYIGLGNYAELARDELFWTSLSATTYYTLGAVPLVLIVSFAVAMLLNQKVRGLAVWRTIFYLPTLVPAIANVVLWIWIFNPDFGLLNSLLRQAGLPAGQWIYDESTAIPSLIVMSTWGFGNTMVIFLAGLQGVPRHLYEAVSIDGGGPWRRFWHVTLPMMTPTIFYNLVVGVVGTFQVFNQAYVMTEGGPNNATLFYVYYLFRMAFRESEMGYASALAWVMFMIIVVVTFLLFRNARRWVYYEMAGAR